MTARVRVGISGWSYPPWRGSFYPDKLPHRRELGYAAERLTSIEINGTFYALQRPSSFAHWRDETPEDFVFAVKGTRFITHMKRLLDPHQGLANFFASGVLALGRKLGPMLWQLPPNFGYDRARLIDFFDALPRTHRQAARLAADHDDRLTGDRLLLESPTPDRPIPHALEVRHDSFATDEVLDLLSEHRIALVIADTGGRWPQIEQLTGDIAYLRLHGADELYVSGYTDAALDSWADKISSWPERVSEVFVYFDNDAKVRAPYDAMALIDRLPRR